MAKSSLLPLLLLLVSFFALSHSQNPNPSSAYDELRLRGFPRGLLPTNVRAYSLDAASGDFAVDLASHCRIVLPAGNYLAAFSDRITGNLADGRISGLQGIRVKAFFRWWSITGIRAADNNLVFEVGIASAKFPARDFNVSLSCGGAGPRKAAA